MILSCRKGLKRIERDDIEKEKQKNKKAETKEDYGLIKVSTKIQFPIRKSAWVGRAYKTQASKPLNKDIEKIIGNNIFQM